MNPAVFVKGYLRYYAATNHVEKVNIDRILYASIFYTYFQLISNET